MPQQDLILPEGWDGYGSPPKALTEVLAALWNSATSKPQISGPAGHEITGLWRGTAAEYAALGTYDATTLYVVTA